MQTVIKIPLPPKKEITLKQLEEVGGIENINKLTGSFEFRSNHALILKMVDSICKPKISDVAYNTGTMVALGFGFTLGYKCAMHDKNKSEKVMVNG